MGLLHHEVTILNFDQMFTQQIRLSERADEWIELADIGSTNMFCTHEALAEIHRRLSARTAPGITFIGSGNYHYISYELLRSIDRPFSLVLFDNHTDAKPSDTLPGFLTCGSWVAEAAAALPLLQQVVMVGVRSGGIIDNPAVRSKTVLLPELDHPQQLLSAITVDDVYISVDKDVLDRADAVTDWDHGTMRLKQLIMSLHSLVVNKNVVGIDVCGELRVPPGEAWRYADQVRLNEQANLAILESVL
ncbi:arginase family protein [Paenibacillus thermotolerans]|uniref:arginase family protein n=1 Tax=Paenibacillus thermotolerans TaxID=3027807 RepID=UPI0023681DAB|nr:MULTISPECIES: arginase family protein [unclassified Paenibacillus]